MGKIYNLIFVIYIIYYCQGLLYNSPTFGKILAFLLVFLLFIGVFKVFSLKDKMLYSFSIFIFYIIGSFIFTVLSDSSILSRDIMTLKAIFLALLPTYIFYYGGRYNLIRQSRFLLFLIFYFILSIFLFYQFDSNFSDSSGDGLVGNNLSYNFVSMIPMLILLFSYKRYVKWGIIFIIYFIVISLKRGALLCLLGSLAVYLITYMKSRKVSLHTYISMLFFVAIILGYLYVAFTSSVFIERFDNISEQTSGRDQIFEKIFFSLQNDSTFFSCFFGNGYNEIYRRFGFLAHNDFIEVFYCFGIIGIFLYLKLLIKIGRVAISSKNLFCKNAMLAALVIWLLKTMTTGVFTGESTFILTMVLGYSYGYDRYLSKESNNSI